MGTKETYSIVEAAMYLGLTEGNTKPIYAAIYANKILAVKENVGGKIVWVIDGESLAEYKSQLGNGPRKKPAEVAVQEKQPVPVAHPVRREAPDDSTLLPRAITSLFQFLSDHHLSNDVRSIQKVVEHLHIWEVQTANTPVQIVIAGERVTVLADEYQRELEAQVQELRSHLREAETRLSYYTRKAQERVLTEYHYPLTVLVESHVDGFLVWSKQFPFAARGQTEGEALAAFRRMIWGYASWLRTHERELANGMREQFGMLKNLLVED